MNLWSKCLFASSLLTWVTLQSQWLEALKSVILGKYWHYAYRTKMGEWTNQWGGSREGVGVMGTEYWKPVLPLPLVCVLDLLQRKDWSFHLVRDQIQGLQKQCWVRYWNSFSQRYTRLCWCCCLVAKWYPTLCDTVGWSTPGSSVHGISQDRTLKLGCHVLLQSVFLTQGWDPHLLLGKWILYH